MKNHIGTVTITTADKIKYTVYVYEDLHKLRQDFIHPRRAINDTITSFSNSLIKQGTMIQTICIDSELNYW